jgi:hypothetical protein
MNEQRARLELNVNYAGNNLPELEAEKATADVT